MELLYERVAGLDVGKARVVVCVRTPGSARRDGLTGSVGGLTTIDELQITWSWRAPPLTTRR